MALVDEVKSRYGNARLVAMTNPQNSPATTIDETRLARAADDVEAEIEIYAGATFLLTDARHVAVAVIGVVLKLMERTGRIKPTSDVMDRWLDRLRALGRVTGRDRILPLAALTRDSEGEIRDRAFFDEREFDPYILGEPRGADVLE